VLRPVAGDLRTSKHQNFSLPHKYFVKVLPLVSQFTNKKRIIIAECPHGIATFNLFQGSSGVRHVLQCTEASWKALTADAIVVPTTVRRLRRVT
jgi:hypothetical protein